MTICTKFILLKIYFLSIITIYIKYEINYYYICTLKKKILYETKSDQNYAVVVKPEDNTKFQTTLYVLEDLKRTKIQNVMLGINKMKKETNNETKTGKKLPLLRTM